MKIRGFAVAFGLFAADIVIKQLVVAFKPDWGNDLFRFTLYSNTGIVFSLPVPNWIYLPVAIAVFGLFVGALALALKRRTSSAPWLTFVVLGALSNLYDRFAYDATIDYLVFFGRSAINLADVMIVIGVVLFLHSQKKK
ncbi:MAG: signal peptidase II [Patescibacteria group bacterium]|nr:signal peptidase II [Patescibacteria group bacterium]